MSGNHHGRHKRKEVPVAKPAVARPAAPAAGYDNGPGFLTFSTKLGLVLIVILSIGLSALIAFAPERKGKKDDDAVAKVEEKPKNEGEKKTEKPEEKGEKKPPEKEPEKKPPEKKPPEKEPAEKKPPEKAPAEKKPPEKEPAEKKPAEKEKEKEKEKPAEKKPADKDKDKDKEKPAEKGTEVVFEKHVLPIFTEKCGKCHGVSGKAGVDLRTMKSILKGGANGPILAKGDLKKSLLWELIDTEQMPQGDDKLTAEEKETIKKWIMGGAKEMAAK